MAVELKHCLHSSNPDDVKLSSPSMKLMPRCLARPTLPGFQLHTPAKEHRNSLFPFRLLHRISTYPTSNLGVSSVPISRGYGDAEKMIIYILPLIWYRVRREIGAFARVLQ